MDTKLRQRATLERDKAERRGWEQEHCRPTGPGRDETQSDEEPLRTSPRRPWLSLRRRHLPSCGTETFSFSSHPAIDASNISASRAWYSRRPARHKRSHSKRGTRSVPGRPEECTGVARYGRDSRRARSSRFATICHATSRVGRFGWPFRHPGPRAHSPSTKK